MAPNQLLVLIGILIFAGAVVAILSLAQPGGGETARLECVKACTAALASGTSLENGPCLSNAIVPDWVCDVAHQPRLPVDELRENQCPDFGGRAHHFVEVSPGCRLLRAA